MFPGFWAFALLLVWCGANTSHARSKHPTKDEQYLHARITTWYQDCRKGWNAASHMSERDYDRACLEFARARIKFLDEEAKSRMRAK